MAFYPLDHAHRLPLPFGRLVSGHVLESLLFIMKYTKHVKFEPVKTCLLYSDGEFVEPFETMGINLQYMLFVLEGLLIFFNILACCNWSDF